MKSPSVMEGSIGDNKEGGFGRRCLSIRIRGVGSNDDIVEKS